MEFDFFLLRFVRLPLMTLLTILALFAPSFETRELFGPENVRVTAGFTLIFEELALSV